MRDSGVGWRCGASIFLILALLGLVLLGVGCSQRLPLDSAPLPFKQAEDAFRLGHYDRAVHGYRIFLDSGEAAELIPRAYFRLAKSEYRLARYDQCIAAIDELQSRYPDTEWRQVYELRGDAEWARGNEVSAVHFWELAIEDAEPARQALLRRRINDAIEQMEADSLARVRTVLQDPQLQARAEAAGARGPQPKKVRRIPSAGSAGAVPAAEGTQAGDLVADARIGVLLPLSGRFASFGERSLKGIRLAFGGDDEKLLVRDTGGEVHLARAALDEMAADPRVVAVLGPLRSKVAESMAPRAEREKLPMLVLAQRRETVGRYVVQTTMTYERQAAQLAEYAVGVTGMKRFGILYPRDGYGLGLSAAFRDQVERRGGSIVGALAYTPGAEEFSVEVVSIQKWMDADGMQAVFIPDFAATATVLAAALRESRPGVFLLGSNGWNDPGQLGAAGDALDGAVFVDGFFIGSQRKATSDFILAYRQVHGDRPQILEAQAYDAARILDVAMQSGEHSRDRINRFIRGLETVEGVGGQIAMGPRGVQRELFLLRLSEGRISEIAIGGAGGTYASPVPIVPAEPEAPAYP